NRSGFHPRRVGPRVLERVLRTDVKSTASFESLYVQKRCQPVLFGSLPVDLAQIVILREGPHPGGSTRLQVVESNLLKACNGWVRVGLETSRQIQENGVRNIAS